MNIRAILKPFTAFTMVVWFCGGCDRPPATRYNSEQTGPELHTWTHDQIVAALVKQFDFKGSLKNVRRNGMGTKLYCVGLNDNNKKTVFVLSATTNWFMPCPGAIAFLNEQQEIVAWTDDYKQGIHLRGGQFLTLPLNALFDIDPSGEYFIIGEKPSRTWLGRINSPETRICLTNNLLAQSIFTRNGEILIAGWMYPTRESTRGIATCVVIQPMGENYRIDRQFNFSWGSVVEVDPYTDRLALRERSDLSPTVCIYSENSGMKIKAGKMTDYVFFFSGDVIEK